MREMEFRDFYELASYGNMAWKGHFTSREIAQNAYDYLCEYNESKRKGALTPTMQEVVHLLNIDGTEDCLEWAERIMEVVPKITINGIIFQHGEDDYGLWVGFHLSEEDENAIQEILAKYDTQGCSVRGRRNEIAREMRDRGKR